MLFFVFIALFCRFCVELPFDCGYWLEGAEGSRSIESVFSSTRGADITGMDSCLLLGVLVERAWKWRFC